MRLQRVRFLWIGFLLLAMLACQLPSPSKGEGPAQAVTPESASSSSDLEETPELQYASEPPEARVDWFKQDDYDPKYLRYCITYTNHDRSLAQVFSFFLITAYDASGNQLGETMESIGWIFPGQSLPVAGAVYLTTDGKVERLDVQAESPGQLAPLPGKKEPFLSVENNGIILINKTVYAVGTLRNGSDKTLTDVTVTALVYDSSDKLIDAEYSTLLFVPAGQQTVVQIDLKVSTEAARVELYPYLGTSAEFLDAQSPSLIVEKAAALQNVDGLVNAIFVVKNSTARAYAGSFYNISLYDAQDKPVAAASGEIAFIFPGSRTAEITSVSYPTGARIARMDVQVQPRSDNDWMNQQAAAITTADPLTFEQVQYRPDPSHFDDKVTLLVKNGSGQSVDAAGVTALLYNAAGQIVGGGSTSIGILPAGGQTQVEVRVNAKGEVDTVEVLPFYNHAPAVPGDADAPPVSPGDAQETPTPSAEAPEILSQWFAQPSENPSWVNFAFLMENPNPTVELLGAEYQAVVFDQADVVLGSMWGRIDLLPAGGRQAVVQTITVEETDTVSRMEITITQSGSPQASASPLPLQAGPASYAHYQELDIISGTVSNSLPQDIPEVTVSALAFDASGKIVGAGTAIGEYFIPGNGQAPVAVKVTAVGAVARAELYLDFPPVQIAEPASTGLQPLKVVEAGFFQDPQGPHYVVAAFVVENPNPGQAIYGTGYQVSLYDDAGVLLATDSTGPLLAIGPSGGLVVYPGSRSAQTVALNVPRETRVARVEVLLGKGQAEETTLPNPLQSDKFTYIATPYPEITGLVLNNSSEEFKGVYICAILYDKDGHIIGSGDTSLSTVPANGQAPFKLMVNSSGEPARVELFVSTYQFGSSNP